MVITGLEEWGGEDGRPLQPLQAVHPCLVPGFTAGLAVEQVWASLKVYYLEFGFASCKMGLLCILQDCSEVT